jgi:hypothetical protein
VLALGLGANTAIFSIVHTMLFASPGYARPAEVLQIYSQDKKNPKTFRGFSYPTYLDIRQQNTAFQDVMAYDLTVVGIGEKGNQRRALAAMVSSNYFSVLGVAPALGRAFLPEEETAAARNTSGRGERWVLEETGPQRRYPRLADHPQRAAIHGRRRDAGRVHRHDAHVWFGSVVAVRSPRRDADRFRER